MKRDHNLAGLFAFQNFSTINPEVHLIENENQIADPPLCVSCSVVAASIWLLIMKKLTLGKKTIHSIQIQVISTLRSMHGGESVISKVTTLRKTSGNFVRVDFQTSANLGQTYSRFFALEKVGHCCDVWLELATDSHGKHINKEAA